MPGAELVGRDEVLSLASRRWSEAAAGHGQTLLIAGEAGIGKSRMLAEIIAATNGATVVRAAAWPRDAEAAGALLLDLASGLRRTGLLTAGDDLARLLESDASAGAPTAAVARHRLVGAATELLRDAVASEPVLLAIDDLHWADELSLDVLQRLSSALADAPALLLVGYRTDELFPGTPAARWRARLLGTRAAEEARLARLDAAATTELATMLLSRLMSSEQAGALFRRSNGIPLHIEELLGAGSDSRVPETVGEAVLLRAAELDPDASRLADAAAVIGRSSDARLLLSASGLEAEQFDRALAELIGAHFMVEDRASETYDFRHALIRDAIYEHLLPNRRRELHARVARAGSGTGLTDAELSDHFERAELRDEAFAHAIAATTVARRADAHREIAALSARALRTAPADLPRAELAGLHSRYGLELQTIDDNAAAAAELQAAIDLLRDEGQVIEAARLVPALNAARYRNGEPLDQRIRRARDAMADLDGLSADDRDAASARGVLHSALATAYMLSRHLEESAAEAQLGLALVQDPAEESALDVNLGSVLVFSGRTDEGWKLLERGIEVAESAGVGLEPSTARGYQMLGSSASVLVEYDRAEHYLDAGLAMTAVSEIWHENHYLRAHRGHVRWATGEPGASAEAAQALADSGSQIAEITARHVLGYAALGRGDQPEALRQLERARELGAGMHELQRLSPALWGLAEAAVLRGEPAIAADLTAEAAAMSAEVADAAFLFPHVVTGTRARLAIGDAKSARAWVDATSAALLARGIPGTLPAIDHAEGLLALAARRTDDARILLERARAGWDERRRFWEGSWVRLDLARVARRARRPGEAAALLGEVRQRAEAAGAPVFARLAAEAASDPNPGDPAAGPLTAREFEVARLVAEGATNREIAARLVLSPKTVSTHVEHILAKLHVARRAEIAAWVVKAG